MTEQITKPAIPGKLIVFEGPDGFGKSTQAQLAFDYLNQVRPGLTFLSKEPGSALSPFCISMREHIFHPSTDSIEQGLLFFLDHYRHARAVERLTSDGLTVISDRWLYSQYCYNSIRLNGPDIDGTALYEKYEPLQTTPDLVIVLGLDKEEAEKRIQARDSQKSKDVVQSQKSWTQTEDYLGKLIRIYEAFILEYEMEGINVQAVTPNSNESPEEVFDKCVQPILSNLFK